MPRIRINYKNVYKLIGLILSLLILSFIIHNLLTTPKNRVVFTQPDFLFEAPVVIGARQKCQLKNSDLKSNIRFNPGQGLKLKYVETINTGVQLGGSWEPDDCDPWQRVAIIIPYRNRAEHLTILLNRLHPLLRKQKIAYQIFVSEQTEGGIFNKGRVVNIGFLEAMKINNFDCIIMHDVDLLPETDKNIYFCDAQARHLSSAVDELGYKARYPSIYGGVIALSSENFKRINGFPNRYSGWGGEDDDVSMRTYAAGLLLTRPPYHIGRYKMILHTKSARSGSAYDNLAQWKYWMFRDGLSTMAELKYKVLSITKHKLYTNITSHIGIDFSELGFEIPNPGLLEKIWLDLKLHYYLYY